MTAVRWTSNVALILLALTATSAAAQAPADTQVPAALTGVVSLSAPEGQSGAVPGVTLALTCGSTEPHVEVSDSDGKFLFQDLPGGTCVITATLDGFKPVSKTVAVKAGVTTDISIGLEIEVLHQEVQVTATVDGIVSNPIASHVETVRAEFGDQIQHYDPLYDPSQ